MGTCTALLLARKGADVTLYEARPQILLGASRWNEGKIHLGYLYSGDASLQTAKQIITGGLQFRPLIEQIIGTTLNDITQEDDLYLVHRDSVVTPDHVNQYFGNLTRLLHDHPDKEKYWGSITSTKTERLSRVELEKLSNPEYVDAGFVSPERSVCTQSIADSLSAAVYAEPGIEVRTSSKVLGAKRFDESTGLSYLVETTSDAEKFFHVVNCLWEGRPKVDASIGVNNLSQPSLRYRCSLFVETSRQIKVPSAVICTGPFGDIKSYNPKKFYLSWYESGLVTSTTDVLNAVSPSLSDTEKGAISETTLTSIGSVIPASRRLMEASTRISVEGGWVFANGRGLLSDPNSSLHRRDQVGIHRTGNWYSVDTGKYSMAPWLALHVSHEILGN
ncbi:hypothetical protein C0039_00060 [Pseudohalioglobus lutimaris]|uniref:FAD dependent oxidoreductase domain-containing protein n=2 Tax=Pseudohalioglobus lutimaris TaxID=1737061 RepID=A0A2N5X7V1_9GAMM|nr:hypothetical protein C0039_00060 [Pseudohalioglobus lutimaris]